MIYVHAMAARTKEEKLAVKESYMPYKEIISSFLKNIDPEDKLEDGVKFRIKRLLKTSDEVVELNNGNEIYNELCNTISKFESKLKEAIDKLALSKDTRTKAEADIEFLREIASRFKKYISVVNTANAFYNIMLFDKLNEKVLVVNQLLKARNKLLLTNDDFALDLFIKEAKDLFDSYSVPLEYFNGLEVIHKNYNIIASNLVELELQQMMESK